MEFEEELWWGLAAQWWGVGWNEFAKLDGGTQSWMIAVFEANEQIQGVLSEATYKSKP